MVQNMLNCGALMFASDGLGKLGTGSVVVQERRSAWSTAFFKLFKAMGSLDSVQGLLPPVQREHGIWTSSSLSRL